MALQLGSRLGPYEIQAPIGAGGMGEVYRATDTKLNRDVALKVLPDAFAQDADRMARFQREAHVLASLNHPNIAAIYGLEEADATRALVLELVDGPTLADRLAQGPVPVDEALPIAKQIADALEAAHEQGIIHRDLKPANIKLRPDGTVKVLDFGLAKALEGERAQVEHANSPTLTAAASQVGVIMGTAAYMSPEQAKGKAVDRRADVWAFGVVLYEMLTGRRAFTGDDVSDILVSIFRDDPDWSSLPKQTPTRIHQTLRVCLQKDARQRVRDVSAVRLAMEGAFELAGPVTTDATGQPAQPVVWPRAAAAAAMVLGGLVLGGLAVWILVRPAPAPITRTSIALPETQRFTDFGRRGLALSPAGTHVAYTANNQLFLRALDELEAEPLTGTEGTLAQDPFFSPDGQSIGFFSGADGTLKKVALSGGAAITLTEYSGLAFGASWGTDATIVFAQDETSILQVADTGGTPELLVAMDRPAAVRQPQKLPGGEALLFTLCDSSCANAAGGGSWDTAQVVVERVATGERTVVVEGGTDARYLPTGHLVYAVGTTLLAVPFDADRLVVTGGPVPLVEGVRQSSGATATGTSHFSVASTGSLAYLPGGGTAAFDLVWTTREGQETPVGAELRSYRWARVSPDGTRLAVGIGANDRNDDVWIYELSRGTLTRLTFDEAFDGFPLWSPDGSRVVFQSLREGGGLYWKAANGTGEVERLLENPNAPRPYGWAADGRLVFDQNTEAIAAVGLEGDRAPELIIESGANPAMSPDGRWIAYNSRESGQSHIYVRPFPNVNDGKWQVSSEPGFDPLWSPDGRELFFNSLAGMMVAQVETEPTFNHGAPTRSLLRPGTPVAGTEFDIAPDGERFLFLSTEPEAADQSLILVQNWYQELLERVPVP